MPRDFFPYVIQPVDVEHALRKWDGRDVVVEGDTRIERFWQATDQEFLDGFSAGLITDSLIHRFAASNNNDIKAKRTGGYSIKRKFWGGLSAWTPRLQEFCRTHIQPARGRYGQTGGVEAVWELTTQLAKMEGQSPKGYKNPLGIVAASKLLFFACPELPFFIYDSFVGAALSMGKLDISEYSKWWHRCNEMLDANSSVIHLLPKDRQAEFLDKEEWFTRRSLDLMLYRLGAASIDSHEEASCFS